ncbi:MAG: cytochrome c [Deltaproteobacteria bacterium]|nr:cytochrome c [Deltaproteobacteria bacterium]MBI2228200.1 cytochrome c [Deltaproteobacteria bacterium]MBI2365635.1 cytochrome c [Deltaproteobacteria bacterium]
MKSRLLVSFGLVLILFAPGLGFAQSKGDAKAGKLKYDANCVGCHGATGKGDGAAAAALNPKPQDHTNGKAMKALSDKYLFDIIKDGGASQKKSPIMPGSGKKFSDQEVWDIVAYIRSLAK